MQIILVGLNHKTASVDVRERLAFSGDDIAEALKQLKGLYPEAEFVLLSTCNRVELYCAASIDDGPDADDLLDFVSKFHDIPVDEFRDMVYTLHNEECVRHLLTVSSSLDSMVLGEPQIVAQVKDSYKAATEAKCTGKILSHLFHSAFGTSKRIYTETSITNRRVSVAGVAIDLASQLFSDIASAKVVVAGAGEMGELLVERLVSKNCKDITVINRSFERGEELAKRHGVAADEWDKIDEHLAAANIVVTAATANDGYLFDRAYFKSVMKKRGGATLLLMDIAVPRNIDPDVNKLENLYLYSIDDLAQVVEENIKLREDDIDLAVEIICDRVAEFMEWFATRELGPLIGQIKETFEKIRRDETAKFVAADCQDVGCKEGIETMVSRVVNKLLHCVIRNINVVAKEKSPKEAAKLAESIVAHAEDIVAGRDEKEGRK